MSRTYSFVKNESDYKVENFRHIYYDKKKKFIEE